MTSESCGLSFSESITHKIIGLPSTDTNGFGFV